MTVTRERSTAFPSLDPDDNQSLLMHQQPHTKLFVAQDLFFLRPWEGCEISGRKGKILEKHLILQ